MFIINFSSILLIINIFVQYIECYEDHCHRDTCINGTCNGNICECFSCYKGVNCDIKENQRPLFEKSLYEVKLSSDTVNKADVLVTVKARDLDQCNSGNSECGCKQIKYSLKTNQHSNFFIIDSKTGQIKLSSKYVITSESEEYNLVVLAKNDKPFDDLFDSASVVLNFYKETVPTSVEQLDRMKRASPLTKPQFTFSQVDPASVTTTVDVGLVLKYKVTIEFPPGPSSLTLEIFAPIMNNQPAMIICGVQIERNGSFVENLASLPAPTLEGVDATTKFPVTRVIYTFANVSVNAAASNSIDYSIDVTFTCVVTYGTGFTAVPIYVSTGSEYLNGQEIYVGQIKYDTLNTPTEPTPTMTLTGDDNIYADSTAIFDFTILAKNKYQGFTIEFYSPLNDTSVLSFCIVNLKNSDGYNCVPDQDLPLVPKVINGITYYYKAVLNYGFIPNKIPTPTDPQATILYKMALRTNPLAISGYYYYVGVSTSHVAGKIFTAKKTLKVDTKAPLAALASPLTHSYNNDGTATAKIGMLVKSILKVTFINNIETDLIIDVVSTDQKSEICGIGLKRVGRNIPCIDQITPSRIQTMSNGEIVGIKFTYKNIRTLQISTNAIDYEVEFYIYFKPINESSINTAGQNAVVGLTLSWSGGTGSRTDLTYTLQPFDPIPKPTTEKLPKYTFNLNGNDGNVKVGYSYLMKVIVQLKSNQMYGPLLTEMFVPTQFQICSARISRVGKNVLCVNKDKPIELIDRQGGTSPDKAQINLGVITTVTPEGQTLGDDDEFEILVSFNVKTTGTSIFVNAGMVISSTQIWVANFPVTAAAPGALTQTAAVEPTVVVSRIDSTSTNIYSNDVAIIKILIKLKPGYPVKIEVAVESDLTLTDSYHVCSLTVVQVGNSISCYQGVMSNLTWSVKNTKQLKLTFDILDIPAGNVSTTNEFDENSIYLQASVKFNDLTASPNIKTIVTYNTLLKNVLTPLTLVTTGSRLNSTTPGFQPTFKMSMAELYNDTLINVTQMAYGEAGRIIVSIKLVKNSVNNMKLIFASRSGSMNEMNMVFANVFKVGRHIQCLKSGVNKYSLSKRTGSLSTDMVTIDLGFVSHIQGTVANETEDDDMIYVESYFVIWKNPASNPTTLEVNGLVLLNNDELHITKITFNTGPDTTHITTINTTATPQITIPAIVTPIQIGSTFDITLNITVPPRTRFKSLKVEVFPVREQDSAHLVQGSVTNTGTTFQDQFGLNGSNPQIPMSSISSTGSSQLDDIILDLGVIQNLGFYYLSAPVPTYPIINDRITVKVNCKLTDNKAGTQGKVITITVGVKFDNILTVNQTVSITIARTGVSLIDIESNTTLNSNDTTYKANVPIDLTVSAKLSNSSLLECRDFNIIVAVPNYIKYVSSDITNYTSAAVAAVNVTNTNNIVFRVPFFFYTEKIYIKFKMAIQAGTKLPKNRQISPATIPVIYTCKLAFNSSFINKVDDVTLTLEGDPIVITGGSCNSDLGLSQIATIPDCQIRSFLSPYTNYEVTKIRYNDANYWKPHNRNGIYNRLRYVDILFGTLKQISTVKVKCTLTNKPTEIDVYGTMDGRAFSFYQKMLITSWTTNEASITLSNPKFIYRGIRIVVAKTGNDNEQTGINLDLMGCSPTGITDTNTFIACTVSTSWLPKIQLPEYYHRGYLYSAPNMFICDEIPINSVSLLTIPRCWRALDGASDTWRDMGLNIGKIIGYDATKSHIYAINSFLSGYLMSEDDGLTWVGINKIGWIMTKNLRPLVYPTPVPWTVGDAGFEAASVGAACTKYVGGSWKICYDGVYMNTVKTLSWDTCC